MFVSHSLSLSLWSFSLFLFLSYVFGSPFLLGERLIFPSRVRLFSELMKQIKRIDDVVTKDLKVIKPMVEV